MNDKLVPSKPANAVGGLTKSSGIGIPALHRRLMAPTAAENLDVNKLTHRLALMLDASGSMGGSKIVSLRDAVSRFIECCNFRDTAVALQTFGGDDTNTGRLPLTVFQPLLMTTVQGLNAAGSTPMAKAMDYVINSYSVTRGIIVSDGQPDSEAAVYEQAENFKKAEIPVDTVHIADHEGSTHGEDCLRRVAEMTGGTFIKFSDINSFARSFKYLSPAFYGQLTAGAINAEQMGAKEVK